MLANRPPRKQYSGTPAVRLLPLCKIMGAGNCSDQAKSDFSNHIDGQLVLVNALLAASTIVIGVMVGIGAYGQRYCHHPLTSFLFVGANTLFLPILSYVISTIGTQDVIAVFSDPYIIPGRCFAQDHIIYVFVWASLVQIAAINTTAIVAGDDKEGRNITPPATVLLVQAIWTSYLVVNFLGKDFYSPTQWSLKNVEADEALFLLPAFALIVAKLLLKYYAWYSARSSLAFGRNPHVIVGYMERLKDESQHVRLASEHSLPPLIVAGEDTSLIQKGPCNYSLKWLSNQTDGARIENNGLVTIDKVWQLEDDMLLRSSREQFKELCFSFALFKLLRCRFARHTLVETCFMKAYNLLPHMLLQDSDDERAFGVITLELSFLHDYYCSPLTTSYSRSWLPILSISISLLSLGWSLACIFYTNYWIVMLALGGRLGQIKCYIDCNPSKSKEYGSTFFDFAPVFLLAVLVVLAEVREIASYICSNWTKVSLICHFVRHASSWQQSPWKKKLLGLVLRRKCKLLNHWVDKMNQCSVLALNPRTTPVALLHRLVPLLDRKKVPTSVKTAVLKPLRSPSWKNRSNGVASLCRMLQLEANNNLLSVSSGVKGIANTMLVAHIATSILEVRRSGQADFAHKIAATHLSRYCAYLVAYVPELLPDDDQWCKSLYKAVQKEGKRALAVAGGAEVAASNPEALVQALGAGSEAEHYVLKNGAELGKKLVELAVEKGEEAAWEVLMDFWSEMILYAAPSDNVDAHAEAIARGGELITLLWALLTHVGVISRPETATTTANAAGDV